MKIIWELFTDVWHLARKYEFRKLTDAEWEQFKARGEELLVKYRKQEVWCICSAKIMSVWRA